MTKPVGSLTQWGALTSGNTSDLDANFTALKTAVNDLGTYSNYTASDTGSANTYTPQYSSSLTGTLAAGLRLQFLANATNTGASTVNATVGGSALGSKSIKNLDGSALTYGQIVQNGIVDLLYDGTQFLLLNPFVMAGNMVLLQTNSPSAASASDFTTGISLTPYSHFVIEIYDMAGSTTAQNLSIQVSTDGGSSWKSGASDYQYLQLADVGSAPTTPTAGGSTGTTSYVFAQVISGGSTRATVNLYPSASTVTRIMSSAAYGTTTTLTLLQSSGLAAFAAVNGFRITVASGTMTGTARLFGVHK